ncbi:hypothetical protein AMK16_25755 [Streptomyces sp. CB00455]|uniref:hypothetical protein n=1 Tax=Streptomyces sp. CB00455 TaxID=1703927 RepID=UPI000939D7C7|nr:hypothetical protein [Streptomyces sp. CB00455]OKK16122.1 hypothetical protein AMK16_25755 [Streptomyces sp. CB00455]
MMSPSRPERAPHVALAAAAIGVAALAFWLYQDRTQQGDFAADPRPCTLVSAETAGRLLAGPTDAVEALPYCNWAVPGLGSDAQPVLQIQVSRSGLDEARVSFQRTKEEPEGKMGPMTTDLSDFGDEAFSRVRYPGGGRVTNEVFFRRSNVVVAVRYAPVGDDIDHAQAGAYDVAAEAAATLGKG